jgi:hypothetical protein
VICREQHCSDEKCQAAGYAAKDKLKLMWRYAVLSSAHVR